MSNTTYSNVFDVYFILGIIAIEGISYLICVTDRQKVAEFNGVRERKKERRKETKFHYILMSSRSTSNL